MKIPSANKTSIFVILFILLSVLGYSLFKYAPDLFTKETPTENHVGKEMKAILNSQPTTEEPLAVVSTPEPSPKPRQLIRPYISTVMGGPLLILKSKPEDVNQIVITTPTQGYSDKAMNGLFWERSTVNPSTGYALTYKDGYTFNFGCRSGSVPYIDVSNAQGTEVGEWYLYNDDMDTIQIPNPEDSEQWMSFQTYLATYQKDMWLEIGDQYRLVPNLRGLLYLPEDNENFCYN